MAIAIILPIATQAQCKNFDEASCKTRLNPYVNYGNYVSTILTSGEYAELNMTFFSNQEYRLAICGLEKVKNLEFNVYDADHNLLFRNRDKGYTRVWDFKLESSQQLIIAIIIPEAKPAISGCVAILNGIKQK
jgi:hypothetical protein